MRAPESSASQDPKFYDNLDDFLSAHRHSLKRLLGKDLTQLRILWNQSVSCIDGPVVLEFEGHQLELEGGLGWFALGLDSQDLHAPVPDELCWVHELPDTDLTPLIGARLQAVKLLSVDSGSPIVGLEFTFDNGEVLNVFDEGTTTDVHLGKIERGTLFTVAFS